MNQAALTFHALARSLAQQASMPMTARRSGGLVPVPWSAGAASSTASVVPEQVALGRLIGVLALVRNQPILCSGLQACVAMEPSLQWLEQPTLAEPGTASLSQAAPDVVLVDADSAAPDSQAELDALQHHQPLLRVVLLKGLPAEQGRHFESLAARAACVLDKSVSPPELVAAIQAAYRGQHGPTWGRTRALTAPCMGHDLTPRERDLLHLLAQGLSNQRIAARLSIALATVKFHVTHILAKLGANNRTMAVLLSLRHGLLEDR